MSDNKGTMSDLFREKSQLLDEMPSSRSWTKIQSKMAKNGQKSNVIKLLNVILSIASTALIAVNVVWIFGELNDSTSNNTIVSLNEYTPSPWSIYNEVPQEKAMHVLNTKSDNSIEYTNQSPKEIIKSSWNYINNSPQNLNNLSAISGTWALPSWFKLDQKFDVPHTLKIFHTNDERYYVHLNEIVNEAYLLQASEQQDKFKVLHPKIEFIDNSKNTVLIVYFENGLIVDYRKVIDQMSQI